MPVAPNLLDQNFEVDEPDRVWAGDISYIRTTQGWLFIAVILDLCSRKVVGWAMSTRIDRQLCLDALQMALWRRRPGPGLLHHSDRGSQYTSDDYQKALEGKKTTCSMSRRGNCWDNAVVESFFATLKRELFFGRPQQDRERTADHRQSLFTDVLFHMALLIGELITTGRDPVVRQWCIAYRQAPPAALRQSQHVSRGPPRHARLPADLTTPDSAAHRHTSSPA